jgi:hypothetical protein
MAAKKRRKQRTELHFFALLLRKKKADIMGRGEWENIKNKFERKRKRFLWTILFHESERHKQEEEKKTKRKSKDEEPRKMCEREYRIYVLIS